MHTIATSELSKVTLGDTTIDGPALWTSNASTPNLSLASVLAWTGTDPNHSLNVMQSSDGVHYGGKVTFNESSASRPAIAVEGPPTTIVLAWTGIDPNHSLNLLCQGAACGTRGSSYKKVTFSDNSFTSPTLARSGSHFYLGWAGTDANHSLNVWPFSLTTSGSGFVMGAKTVLPHFSSVSQPNLSVNPQTNVLLLTWDAAAPASYLAFATSTNGTTWTGYGLGEASAAGPNALAVASSGMPPYWMTWTGATAARSVYVRFSQSFPTWPNSNITMLGEAATGGPALGYVGIVGEVLLAWTGIDAAQHLNIATLASAGTPTLDQRIDSYIAGLSTTQLIGQTIMMSVCTNRYSDESGNLSQALQQWDVGSAIIYTSCNGGPTMPPPPAANLQALDSALQSHANHAGTLIIGIDQEGGTVDRLAPYFGGTPSAQSLGQSGNPQNAYNAAATEASRMQSVGLNTDFAPVADVYQGGGEGASRMFGSTVGTVTTYAGAFLDGLQQQQHGIAGTLKHWPGIGAATGNPDLTLPTINQSQATMQANDFAPFANLLYQNPGMVMVTTVLAPAYDAHAPADLSRTLVTSVLRGQLGYRGVVITDALGAQGIVIYMQQQGYTGPAAIGEAGVRAFLAGDDLLLCPLSQSDLQAVVNAMTSALSSGRITAAELDAAVHRIIRLKVELGVLSV